jgi:hypothetical protein
MRLPFLALILLSSVPALAAKKLKPSAGSAVETTTETKEDGTKVTKRTRYRSQQTLDFDSQNIQGGVKRPESSVVTGNRDEVTDGLLSLREDFLDHAKADAGVE